MRKNKTATAEYHRKWYAANKKKRSAYIQAKTEESKKVNQQYANDYVLNIGCKVCGYKKCARALDFHHIDPKTKKKSVADLVHRYGLETVKKEIAKCVVLCARCHREFHAGIIELPL